MILDKININGKIFTNFDTLVKKNIYNLRNYYLYAFDIFIQCDNAKSLSWILDKNSDLSSRVSLLVDGNQTFNISRGNIGESFSNPILFKRTNQDKIKTRLMVPTHNTENQEELVLISGSDNSSAGPNWLKGLNTGDGNDSISFEIIPSNNTDYILLNEHIRNIMFIIIPSETETLDPNYFYFDTQSRISKSNKIGVTYS